MADYLHSLGLKFLAEDENIIMNFLSHVLQCGTRITGYYGLPYFNEHFGSSQIVCRTGHDPNSEKLQLTGFDTHADSMCAWKMRIEQKLEPKAEDDPTQTRLMVKDMHGDNPLIIDVVNGDILPSFRKDEVIELQMVAFADKADFYADEDAYAEAIEPGINGKKLLMSENHIFPVGLFTESEAVKDVVQIHGTIKRLTLGTSQFNEQKLQTNLRCTVNTQFGEIVTIMSLDDIGDVKNNANIREGKVIDCYARLSGDAAIYAYENGIVKNQENNLKLVAYTLQEGDPERLRSVLSKDFVYHSENGSKHIEDANELVAFINTVHRDGLKAHTQYAAITHPADDNASLEYPIGTRCAVISYEGEDGYGAIVFVDTNDDGDIKRIYLSKDARYRFVVDNPFPKAQRNLDDLIEKATYKSSIIGRAHFYGLIDDNLGDAEIDEFIICNQSRLESELADLFDRNITEDVFAEAFLRGIRKSAASNFKVENMLSIGQQFYRDATCIKTEEVQKTTFHDALILVAAIGHLCKEQGNSGA